MIQVNITLVANTLKWIYPVGAPIWEEFLFKNTQKIIIEKISGIILVNKSDKLTKNILHVKA